MAPNFPREALATTVSLLRGIARAEVWGQVADSSRAAEM